MNHKKTDKIDSEIILELRNPELNLNIWKVIKVLSHQN
jgi:hypothetical protein